MIDVHLKGRGITDPAVLSAMASVPREAFVPEASRSRAYDDCALPLSHQQTISQPYVVALMTERLAVRPGMTVLEVGMGSGYQSAVLLAMGVRLFAIDRLQSLTQRAVDTLRKIVPPEQFKRLHAVTSDGARGLPEHAPFDRILVAASPPALPQPLLDQLAVGGRLVIPVGDRAMQRLTIVTRTAAGLHTTTDIQCRFVPLVGEHGWPER